MRQYVGQLQHAVLATIAGGHFICARVATNATLNLHAGSWTRKAQKRRSFSISRTLQFIFLFVPNLFCDSIILFILRNERKKFVKLIYIKRKTFVYVYKNYFFFYNLYIFLLKLKYKCPHLSRNQLRDPHKWYCCFRTIAAIILRCNQSACRHPLPIIILHLLLNTANNSTVNYFTYCIRCGRIVAAKLSQNI